MILHEVITAEKVPFHYRVAGFGSRLLAWLADAGLVILVLFIGLMISSVLEIGAVKTPGRQGVGAAFLLLWAFVLMWGYFLGFEWLWNGQTLGKRLVGIRVIDRRGTSISFFQSAARNLLRFVDAFPWQVHLGGIPIMLLTGLFGFYGLGFCVAALNRKELRLGDLAAGTLVVQVERKAKPIWALQEGAADVRLANEVRLRQRLLQPSREQKQTLLDLCLRRDQLRASDRAQLFQAVADWLQVQLDVPAEEHMSAEKFVLQVAAVLGGRE